MNNYKRLLCSYNKIACTLLLLASIQSVCIGSISIDPLFASGSTGDNTDPPEVCDVTNCEAGFYQTIDSDGKLVRYEYDGFSLGFTQVSVFGFAVNATAFNIMDSYLYTVDNNNNRLIQFSTDGTWTNLGFISLPETVAVGSFDNEGNYYVCGVNGNRAFKIDVNTLAVETIPFAGGQFRAADWVYLHCQGKFYGVGNDNRLYAFDPSNSSIAVTNLTGNQASSGHYGGAFTDINGALYVSNNTSGGIYSIDVNSGVSTLLLNGPFASTNDGTSCPCTQPPFPTLFPQDDEICMDAQGGTVQVLLNDSHSFAELDNSSFQVIQQPTNGMVFYTQSSGTVFYLSDDATMADSFVYEICLDISPGICEEAIVYFQPSALTVFDQTICAGEEFVLDGFPFTETGEYVLNYLASNGCDSTVMLNLEVLGDQPMTFVEQICEQEEFVFDSIPYTESGIFEFNFMSAQGCDSIVVLDLTVNPVFDEVIEQSICEGGEYEFDNVIYDEEGLYVIPYTTAEGCDSTYTINLIVNENRVAQIQGGLCDGEVYELNGITYTESGEYTQDLTTVNGCDSTIILTIEVAQNVEANLIEEICQGEDFALADGTVISEDGDYEFLFQSSNGCDSTLFLRLHVLLNSENQIDETICANETYTLPDGTAFTENGSYELIYPSANGCDSTLILNLVVNEVFQEEIVQFICAGESVSIGSEVYTETGEYTNQLLTSTNCDSIINLNLTVGQTFLINMEEEICDGESYTFGENTLTSSGVFEQNLFTTSNCDSTVVLELRVLENRENNIDVAICAGSSYDLGATTYAEAGIYSEQFVAANGCDSLVTLDLSIAPNFTLDIEESICDGESFIYNGVAYAETGDHEFFIEGQDGCDSIINLSVRKFNAASSEVNAVICSGESFSSGGVTYNQEGLYTQDYFTTNGCDSIVTIDLRVDPEFEFIQENAICEGEQVQVGEEVFTTGGTYELMLTTINGCDSLIILNLTEYQNVIENRSQEICEGEEVSIGSDVYSTTGLHTSRFNTVQGCDSTIVLDLTVNISYEFFDQAQICETESFEFAGQTFSENGIHEVRLLTSSGCDSILVLDLVVNDHATTTLDETICFGSSYSFGGLSYTEGGEYTQDLSTSNGCDSTVILNLILADRFETNLTENICEGERVAVGTEFFDETGTYEVLMLASNGCDSLVTLNLVRLSPSSVVLEASICSGSSYTFGNEELESADEYTLLLTNVNGCDSLVTLDLQILEVYELDNNQEICEGGSYEIGSSSYTSAGTYFDTFTSSIGCDSTIVTHLVVRENTMSELEVFTCIEDEVGQETTVLSNSFGCDSTILTNIVLLESSMSELEVFTCFEDEVGQQISVLSNSVGCDSTVVTNTFLSPSAECFVVVSVDGMTIPCMESFGLLSVEIVVGTPPFTINWSGPMSGSQVANSLGTFDLENLPPGNYTIEVIDANGNTADGPSEILEFDLPAVVADIPLNSSGFNIDCFGGSNGSASVNAIGGEAPYTYVWSTGATTEEIQDLNAGVYSVTLTDANNCIDITEVEIIEPTLLEIEADPIDLTCDDAESGVVTITSSGGVPPYTYAINDTDPQAGNTFIDLSAGDYESLVVDANGCTTESEFSLFMPTAVEVELGDDISIELGDIVQLQAQLNLSTQDINTVEWSENLETTCPDCLVQTFRPSESGIYTIYVLDENGCETTDNVVINVDNNQTIYAPNAFSPNGDGINDRFTLFSDLQFSPIISELHIYDRWGTEVFANYDFPPNADEFGWDGSFRGEPHNPGVFVYHATVEFINGSTAFLKGDITLVK